MGLSGSHQAYVPSGELQEILSKIWPLWDLTQDKSEIPGRIGEIPPGIPSRRFHSLWESSRDPAYQGGIPARILPGTNLGSHVGLTESHLGSHMGLTESHLGSHMRLTESYLGSHVGLTESHLGSHPGSSIIPPGIPGEIPPKIGGIPAGRNPGSQVGLAGSRLVFLPG